MKRRLLYLVLLLTFFVPIASVIYQPQPAAADNIPGLGYNYMQYVADHCHDLQSIEHNFGLPNNTIGIDNPVSQCHAAQPSDHGGVITNINHNDTGWEEVLNSSMGCSSSMFYQYSFTDPNDSSSTNQQRWYTHIGAYKDCYNKAQNMFNNMTNPQGQCVLVVPGSQNDSNCSADVHNLYRALGCSTHMLKQTSKKDSSGSNYSTVDPNDPTVKNCQQHIDDIGKVKLYVPVPGGNVQSKQMGVSINDPSITAGSSDPGTDQSGSTTDSSQLGCNYSSNPLSWIICPVVNMMVDAISATDSLITQEMDVPTQTIFCSGSSTCDDYYSAWASFRNIALGLMVVAGLVIIIGQAVGMEILDAYTIRKTLPRLLVAAIAITISWPLMNFLLTLSNDVGFGVRDLITAPFHDLSSSIDINFSQSFAGNLFGGLGTAAAGVGAAAAWIAFGGLGIMLSYVATAGLAVLVAMLVLILRQIVIIMMILIAPIAIVAYILPNTQRIYRLWWESFSKALLMFPLIAAFIAAGRVFSAISLQSGDPIHGFIGLIAYFGPYFMIPLTFRMSGGIMSGMGNFVNQRAQGGFSGLSGYRSRKSKERIARQRNGGLYNAPNPLARAMNTIGDYTIGADENLAYDFGTGNRLGAIGRAGGKYSKYNPIGILGRTLVGGKGAELAAQIGHSATETTQKAAQKANIHHSTAKAMLGFLGDEDGGLGKGLTPEGRRLLPTLYPPIRDKETDEIIGYEMPENGDTAGLQKLGHFLQDNSYDMSDAKYAGGELIEKAGMLSRFGLDMETKRATQKSVAGLVLASEGKLSPDQNNFIRQQDEAGHRPGSAEAIVAAELHTQREQAATQQRHSVRRGKGSMPVGNGEFVSVGSEREVTVAGENGEPVKMPAYKTDAAAAALDTLREDAASSSKGEIWDDIERVAVHHGGADRVAHAKAEVAAAKALPERDAIERTKKEAAVTAAVQNERQVLRRRELVAKAIGTWGRADPGGKAKADRVAAAMGLGDDEISKASGVTGGADAATRGGGGAAAEAAEGAEADAASH